jgi:voltage-gated potassium channel
LRDVAQALEEKFYAPGQSIINIGDHGEEMFIIGHGSVEVSLADGKTIATLGEGSFFGEVALLQETTRTANVRAQAYCDLFLLKKSDFLRIIKDFPELLSSMKSERKN